MKSARTIIGFVLVLVLIGFGRAAAQGATASVSILDFKFEPATLSVTTGTTVTWKNNGAAPHTVTAADGSWDSGNLDPGATFSKTFDTAASVAYYCKYHGAATGTGMSAKVEVTAQAQPTAVPATAVPAPSGPTPSISASNQAISNGTITVASVVAAQDGWIAVHKNGPDGKLLLTPLAGLAPVKAGTSTNVVVKLDESFAAGAILSPMLHIDAGTIGTYEFPGGPDTPVQADGKVVVVSLTVTEAAAPVPPSLPNTAGTSAPVIWVLAAALALVGLGTLLLRRRRAA
jgi:LPXTG-motif cell wall-anchored protein